ncbi:MAG: hypothetical protein LBC61_04800 [Candidatus Peribacteria bacterium]|jgi:hypothetical protein|nr:hypothetical protein [Candidatus Peribacteria bacterium]
MLEENSTLKNSFDEQLLVEETINNFYNWYDYLLLETNKIPDQKVRNFLKKIPDIIR